MGTRLGCFDEIGIVAAAFAEHIAVVKPVRRKAVEQP